MTFLLLFSFTACSHTSAAPPESWLSLVYRNHPLVGTIWDVRNRREIDWETLRRALEGAAFVLLGERHDNADHHQLQARVIRALAQRDGLGAVALEMLRADVGAALEDVFTRDRIRGADIRDAVEWSSSGWPPWEIYAVIADEVLAAGRPLLAADLSTATQQILSREGAAGLSSEARRTLGFAMPFSNELRAALIDDIRASHCGFAAEEHLSRMIDVQRARDAHMARVLIAAGAGASDRAVVLITGGEHVRRDWGVPRYLAAWAPGKPTRSLLLAEVDPDGRGAKSRFDAPDFDTRFAAFDYVWLTPRVDDFDPCERFRERLERMSDPT